MYYEKTEGGWVSKTYDYDNDLWVSTTPDAGTITKLDATFDTVMATLPVDCDNCDDFMFSLHGADTSGDEVTYKSGILNHRSGQEHIQERF